MRRSTREDLLLEKGIEGCVVFACGRRPSLTHLRNQPLQDVRFLDKNGVGRQHLFHVSSQFVKGVGQSRHIFRCHTAGRQKGFNTHQLLSTRVLVEAPGQPRF